MKQTTNVGIAMLGLAAAVALPAFGAAQELPTADRGAPERPTPTQTTLDSLAAAVRAEVDAPALGLAVVRPEGEPAVAGSEATWAVAVAGVRCADEDAPVTPSDRWHWGSIGKSMTATLVARLVEKGVVAWDDTMGEYLGGRVPEMRDEYRDATFVHLLSHRAGIAPNIPIQAFAFFGQAPDDPAADRLRWVEIAVGQDPVGPKEETYEYSNSGYVIAAAMLEAATGESWETLVRREVFEPLGMTSAGFGAPWDREPGAQPCGHRPQDDGDAPVRARGDNPSPMGPAGRTHTTLADMAAYLAAHASRRTDFLGPKSWDRLHSPPFGGNYALGWVAVAPETRWHNGSNTMWYAEVIFGIDGAAAAVVVNDGDIGSVQPAVRALLGRLIGGG